MKFKSTPLNTLLVGSKMNKQEVTLGPVLVEARESMETVSLHVAAIIMRPVNKDTLHYFPNAKFFVIVRLHPFFWNIVSTF